MAEVTGRSVRPGDVERSNAAADARVQTEAA
jgi:hypothetical protein